MKSRVKFLLGFLIVIIFIFNTNPKTSVTVQTNQYYQPNLEITTGNYYLKNTIIKRIPLRKNSEEFINNLKVIDGNLNLKCEPNNNFIGTGCLVEVSNETTNDNYTLVVEGDVTGDGNNTITDIVKMAFHNEKKKSLTGVYFEAADINNDNKITEDDLTINGNHLLSQEPLPTIDYEHEQDNDSKINLPTTLLKINRGTSQKIEATIDSDIVSIISYKSQDKSIATVDSNGLVTALKPGTTKIVIGATNGQTAILNIEVTVEPTGILITPDQLTLIVGTEEQLKAVLSPSDVTETTLTWTSADDNIATVDKNGKVAGKNTGITTITATTTNNKTATITVEVKKILSESINVTPVETSISLNETTKLTAHILPENTTDKTVAWTSNDPTIATVDENGLVTPHSVGTALITATTTNGKTATSAVKVTPILSDSISLADEKLTLKIGETKQLTATVLPENTTNKTVTWTSSDPSVAFVDENGLLSTFSIGKTTITASTTNNKTATLEVEVTPILSDSITITSSSTSIKLNETAQLTATVLPENTTDKTVTWTSSDSKIATVNEFGLVTPVAVGKVTITAVTTNKKEATIELEIVPILSESLTVSPTDSSLNINETVQLSATILPENTTDQTVTWTSSDSTIAVVDKYGLVQGVGVGTVTITATTTNNLAATATITVNPILSESITLTPSVTNMNVSETQQLEVIFLPEDTTNKTISWTSSNSSVATVNENGVVTAKNTGTATITAMTSNNKTASATIIVNPVLSESITITPSSLTTRVGSDETLTAVILPSNTTDQTVTWKSSDQNIVTVDQNGKITAIGVGTATIAAETSNGKVATATITVQPIEATSISFNINSFSLPIGLNKQLIATILPENTTDQTIIWNSNDSSVATVDENGLVTAVGVGTATISARTSNNKVAIASVEVTPVTVESITLNITEVSLELGLTKQLTATIYPENATDKAITWSSADESIATVDAAGLVRTVGIGSTTITATTTNGKTAQVKIVVTPVLATSIVLSQYNLTLSTGKTEQLAATVYPENAANKSVTWSSSNPSIASVDENGLVTAHKSGTAIITATSGDGAQSAACNITVEAIQLTLSNSAITLVDEDSQTLTATLSTNTIDQTITWTSSDTTIATVDSNGKVKAKGVGSATITATSNFDTTVTATCKITVRAAKVLFVGNSKTYKPGSATSDNGIPKRVKDIANNAGYTIEYVYAGKGGASLEEIYTDYLSKITSQKFDYVIVQEKTALYYASDDTSYYNGVLEIADKVKEKNSSAKIYIRKLWVKSNSSSKVITTAYNNTINIADEININRNYDIGIINDGEAFYEVLDNYSDTITIFQEDDLVHQNATGAYLSALCIYSTLFENDPTKITYNASINSNIATTLKKIAKTYCYNT